MPSTHLGLGWRGDPAYEMVTGSNRHLTANLLDPSTIGFDVSGYAFDATQIREGVADITWRRDDTELVRGRIVGTTDSLDTTDYTVAVECVDYRGVLDQRMVYENPVGSGYRSFISTAPETVVWDLLSEMQAQLGGDMNITQGLWPATGQVYSSFQVADGDSVWKGISTLSAGQVVTAGGQSNWVPGFDFDIDPTMAANLYYPYRSNVNKGAQLDYGGTVAKVARRVDMRQFANSVRQSGAQPSAPVNVVAPDIDSRIEGRWDAAFSDPSLYTPESVAAWAQRNYNNSSQIVPSYTLTLAPGRWEGPDHIWLGDLVTVAIRVGRLKVHDLLRVYTVDITLDDNDVETVAITVGKPKTAPLKSLTDWVRALNKR